jgi:hypothetical protein
MIIRIEQINGESSVNVFILRLSFHKKELYRDRTSLR